MSLDAPPLTPDADTARRWAVDELAQPEYSQGGTSWLVRILDWFSGLFDDVSAGTGGGVGPVDIAIGAIIAAAVVALVVWLVVGPLRRTRRARTAQGLFEDDRTSAELERTAREAARAGDWAAATLDLYRALILRLGERGALAVSAGLTAAEAASLAGRAVPELSAALAVDAEAFDGIRYGHAPATEATFAHVSETFAAARRPRSAVGATEHAS
ncbi:DUF4129 domain-containing protein [Demequina mangrovi]|uniref:Protein-glutamine gamma-glutamyltransferase-like C-terminal domain-containing protein n=1 Tax=Demequina mangrovi TaxID=1043493 RepID=A0A1H6X039_9MICO|nr:DUF4129 domain-containing protein [Demequina mangrovi]SEJ20904.1 protein of unknown function [Demequina mangrovi]